MYVYELSDVKLSPSIEETVFEVSTQTGYALWSTTYNQEDNPLIAVEELITTSILASLSGDYALDLGTGTGRYAIRLAQRGWNVAGLDESAAMLTVARQVAEREGLTIDFRQQSLESGFPYDNEQFDPIIAALTLCHIIDFTSIFQEVYRVLRPGGYFLITDFHPAAVSKGWRTQFKQSGATYLLPNAHHKREAYLQVLCESGFTIRSTYDLEVGAVPYGFFSPELVERWGKTPFCLVITAVVT